MRRVGGTRWVVALAIAGTALGAGPAWGQGDEEDEEDADERSEDDRDRRDRDDAEDDGDEEERDKDREDKGKAKDEDDDGGDSGGGDGGGGGENFEREEDNTRPGGGGEDGQNSFLKDRFFVDKVENKGAERSTLVQGSLTSSNFYYLERSGNLEGLPPDVDVPANSNFARMFTDLRLQFDAMHLGGSRWDFRFDGRTRFVNNPPSDSNIGTDFGTRVQSGLQGRNEYDLKEMWFVRGGERADIFFGRQYINDLGSIKVDGLRLDYASTNQLTLLGFVGAYPNRQSRSIGFDYLEGRDPDTGERIGRIIPVAFGGGAAYRTERTYGSFGAVAIVPFKYEQPRVYVTSNGYWRRGATIDLYHFVIFDVYGSAGLALTNLSLGVNWKPAQRIRATLGVHRVDTETLSTVAQAFLQEPDPAAPSVIRNDVRVYRIASDQARGGLSVALGKVQQIEVSTSLAYRRRPELTLYDNDPMTDTFDQTLSASQSVEVLFQILHRNLFGGTRVGLEGSRVFGVGGGAAYARTASFTGRLFLSREFAGGKAEWEAEGAYTTARDDNVDVNCNPGAIDTCYGSSKIGLTELGGTVFYRLRRDLFAVGMANVGYYTLAASVAGMPVEDPALISFSAYLRLAYRF